MFILFLVDSFTLADTPARCFNENDMVHLHSKYTRHLAFCCLIISLVSVESMQTASLQRTHIAKHHRTFTSTAAISSKKL